MRFWPSASWPRGSPGPPVAVRVKQQGGWRGVRAEALRARVRAVREIFMLIFDMEMCLKGPS